MDLQEFYNNKYPKVPVTYKGRAVPKSGGQLQRLDIDVRTFICPADLSVLNFVKGCNIPENCPLDERAHRVQVGICKFLTYQYDKKNQGLPEFWQFPFETTALRIGDCEDGSILMTSAILATGVPNWRVRVAAGFVQTGDPHAPTGGHAYTCYLRESDNKWVALDWCFYPDPQIEMSRKEVLKTNQRYKKVWFSFNNEFAWGDHSWDFENLEDLKAK